MQFFLPHQKNDTVSHPVKAWNMGCPNKLGPMGFGYFMNRNVPEMFPYSMQMQSIIQGSSDTEQLLWL